MPDERYRTTIGRSFWKKVVVVVLSLQVLDTLGFGRKAYVAEEALVVIFLVAISMVVLLLLVVTTVLIQAGIHRSVLWMSTGIVRLAKLRHRHVGVTDPIILPPL
jgi:hypothetical protein